MFDDNTRHKIKEAEDKFVEEITKRYKGKEFKSTTRSEIEVKPVYHAVDVMDDDYGDLSLPGQYPYTRGIYPIHYQFQPWMDEQIIGFGTPDQLRTKMGLLLAEGGAKGYFGGEAYNLIFDQAAMNGCNPDHPSVMGRIVDPVDYDVLLDELSDKLIQIPDEQGNSLKIQVFKRKEIHSGPFAQYGTDLFILFDECRWNISEMVGYGRDNIYSFDTPLGPDDGADGLYGYFCIAGPGVPASGEYIGATLLDVMDLEIPKKMEGKSILGGKKPARPPEEGDKVHSRLKALGY